MQELNYTMCNIYITLNSYWLLKQTDVNVLAYLEEILTCT